MIRPRATLFHRLLHVVAFVLAVALPGRVTASWRWYRRLAREADERARRKP